MTAGRLILFLAGLACFVALVLYAGAGAVLNAVKPTRDRFALFDFVVEYGCFGLRQSLKRTRPPEGITITTNLPATLSRAC